MPYPMRPWPTPQQFASELSRFEVTLERRPYKHVKAAGDPYTEYLAFVRHHQGQTIEVPIDPALENECLMPDVIRSICRRLEIDVTELMGFELG